jgi:hypothetical protein
VCAPKHAALGVVCLLSQDAEIRKLEREVKALTATLASLSDMNSNYRLSQTKADLSGSDGEKLRKLQAQSKAAADVLFRKKRDLQHAATDVDEVCICHRARECGRGCVVIDALMMTGNHPIELVNPASCPDPGPH